MEASDIRGFNYDGSWGTSGLDLWQHHQHGTMAVEIARAKKHFPGWNVARWWLSDEAFYRNPDGFLANFEAGLSTFARHDILVIPVLFNRWRDPVCDFGGVALEHIVPGLSYMSTLGAEELFIHADADPARKLAPMEKNHVRYLESVVGPHVDDIRIYAWDLCNEPLMGSYAEDPKHFITEAELRWLRWCYQTCKRVGAVQPLIVSNYTSLDVMKMTEDISDIIVFHPYYLWNATEAQSVGGPGTTKENFRNFLDDCVAMSERTGKSLYASETVWGAHDDAVRTEQIHFTLSELNQRGIGYTVHALQHSLVADLHYASYGPVGFPEAMHFVNPDGEIRPGHEAFNDYC